MWCPISTRCPPQLVSPRLSRADAARTLSHYLAGDGDPLIIADWPEDVALFNALLVTGPGTMAEVPEITLSGGPAPGFSTAANSKVPHNALHDARALRDHIFVLGVTIRRRCEAIPPNRARPTSNHEG